MLFSLVKLKCLKFIFLDPGTIPNRIKISNNEIGFILEFLIKSVDSLCRLETKC